jgi:hypothetical protein
LQVDFSGRTLNKTRVKDEFVAALMAVALIYNNKENYLANQDAPRKQRSLKHEELITT